MRIKKPALAALCLLIFTVFIIFPLYMPKTSGLNATFSDDTELTNKIINQTPLSVKEQAIRFSSQKNHEIIDEIFQTKFNNFSTLNYFPQFYEPSLRAIYYVLYISNKLGRLDQINETEILNFIMSYYDESTHLFSDKYSQRYLDTDFSQIYYPLSSILEINCYAILSLDILHRLDLINIQEFINYIWSCYNEQTSGFTGRPYDTNLPERFKLSTMDNTYYAIITLNLLMAGNWALRVNEKYELIQYISGLQSISSSPGIRGGFSNDRDPTFDSLEIFEPNLFSSYYCVKSLKVFSMEDSINVPNFKQYLKNLYDTMNKKFAISYQDADDDYLDVVATTIGVDLSDVMGFTEFDRTAAINFVLNNRDSLGIWYGWTTTKYHELIDSFEIIRSLSDSGELSRLSAQEKTQISLALVNFHTFDGFSLISRDYASQKLLYIITSACELYDRISEIDLQYLYDRIENSYYYNSYLDFHGFCACVNFLQSHTGFRSRPIEYYNSGTHDLTEEIDVMVSHKSTYMALKSLKEAFKLDDFQLTHDLVEFVNTVLSSQFLITDQENFGAFLPFATFSLMSPQLQNKKIFFEYSYYAIKTLEFLANYLEMGPIVNLNFDKDALDMYIIRNIVENASTLYFNPKYTNNLDAILQNTYYAIYVLKSINRYNLNVQKIKNFVEQNIDYTNIKNIYYCYKISEILNLNLEFNIDLTQRLVNQTYSKRFHEFYLTTDRTTLDQEVFAWVCEMAKHDRVRIFANYSKSTPLESSNNISAMLGNIILNMFGPYAIVKFESVQLGTFILNLIAENLFQKEIFVPASSQYYPSVQGYVCAYEASKKMADIPISFNTTYEIAYKNQSIAKNGDEVIVKFDASFLTGAGIRSLVINAHATAEIYMDSIYLETVAFSRQDLSNFTSFTLRYAIAAEKNYLFKVFLNDGIVLASQFVSAFTLSGNAYVVLEYDRVIDLGCSNALKATLYNLISGPNTIVKFESLQLGTFILDKIESNAYQKMLEVPLSPNYYPIVKGNLCVYENGNKVLEMALSFNTSYDMIYESLVANTSNMVSFYVKGSILAGGKSYSMAFSKVRVDVYENGVFLEKKDLIRKDFANYSEFSLKYNALKSGNYSFKGYLEDGLEHLPVEVFYYSCTFFVSSSDINSPGEDGSNQEDEGEIAENDTPESNTSQLFERELQEAIPFLTICLSTPLGIFTSTSYFRKKLKVNK